MKNGDFKLTPWEVSGNVDYKKIVKEFGVEIIKELPEIFDDELLFRRKIIFAHRDFGKIVECIKRRKNFVMMTGLMPSGNFHIGHMLIARQMIFYQKLGAKLYIAVADLEAYNSREKNLKELRKIAIDQYLVNYIALGLKSENCDFYFQSERSRNSEKANAYYRLAMMFSRYATFNEFKAVYGEISPGKMSSALLQAADMYHPQLKEFEGKPIPVVIPVGIDQDPHIRIARDMAGRLKDYKFFPISSTYNLFLPGLKGGKMSSSDILSYVSMTDSPTEVESKIKKYAFSGGRDTLEEHKKYGGNPDQDVSFQYLKMFFEHDDDKLKEVYEDYKSGKLLTSELKEILIGKINSFLREHQKKRQEAKKYVSRFLFNKHNNI